MPLEVRKNDLEVYEPVTDPNGPAMTWVRAACCTVGADSFRFGVTAKT